MSTALAARIKELRNARGWTRTELGRRLGGKNPRVMVYRWEEELAVPSVENVARLAEIFAEEVSAVDRLGEAWTPEHPRKRQQVDKADEVDKIAYSQPPTTMEGLMRDQVDRLKSALSLVPQERRDQFIHRMQVLAAQWLLEAEEPGVLPGKQRRASGKG